MPQWAHSVHAEPQGLRPDREYWYRFHAGDATSPVGRTRTAPGADALSQRLRFGVASCQHFEQGWFGAFRHVADDGLDLFLPVGDYIYESSWGEQHVRKHGSPEPHTLEDYRRHFALYKTAPDLQAAHASCPWLVIWDDHELVTTSITSRPPPEDRIQAMKAENPHVLHATGAHRGYLRLELTPQRLTADLRGVSTVEERAADCITTASFVVEGGRLGPQPA